MKIGVNYRLGLNPASGIPLTIKHLYQALAKLDSTNTYIRFIPKINTPSLLFDTIVCSFLLKFNPVSVFHGPSYILPLWKPKDTKFIVTIHDLAFIALPEVATTHFKIIYRILTTHSLSIADRVIAVSDNTKRDIIKYFSTPDRKITVIPNGISDVYLTSPLQPPLIQGDYVLTITTHPQRKNTPLLFAAFKLLKKNNMKLVVVDNIGNDDRVKLKNLTEDLGISNKVVFTGRVSELQLASLYQHARLFVYPSIYEGFGLPLLEAMACGCLVLGSKVSSLPEIIPDPKCLFFPVDAPTLAQAMDKLLSLSAEQKDSIIKKLRKYSNKYSWFNSAKKYLSVFKKLKYDYKL
ncbi:MAG: Glycosyl transferase, group 1 [Candidatus Woesebacteria bacterium GW2011_GWB1_38_5b]|uniref:Glycosyl transferase, group 1 n=1 Tax=Candidatus Woesebacteria bacterium GW2011_GWB1_38_5b TaxID=1618569 RepID=A0A0G0K8B3_9BACT|nr:MAG: Glycosyl transferase, group 1 [Candidatus Woesebacteria bacterium GW2011_GWB1_38_5b]